MKKSVLSIVAIAFAAVSVLSSCDKNDDGYGQSAKTTTVQSNSNSTSSTSASSTTTTASEATYHGKCFFIDDNFAQYGTFKIVVSDGNQTAEYDLATQGKHGTYTLNTTSELVTATGYMLEVVLPTKQNLTVKATFVPNDKAKTLTDKDDVKNIFGVATSQGNDPQLKYKFFVSEAIEAGDNFIEYANNAANIMSIKK